MAISYRVASRYAKSLIDLAKEQKALPALKSDMEGVVKLIQENRDFELMLGSPIVPHQKKLAIMNKMFKGKVHKITESFILLLTKKNREEALYGIAKQFLVQYNISEGIQVARIESSVPLTAALKKQVSDAVAKGTGKKIELEESVNEELIGGYILRVEDKQIDKSIKGNLLRIKQSFESR